MTTKNGADLTLYDKLSRLTYTQAARLLGPDAIRLLTEGGGRDIDIDEQVDLGQHARSTSDSMRFGSRSATQR